MRLQCQWCGVSCFGAHHWRPWTRTTNFDPGGGALWENKRAGNINMSRQFVCSGTFSLTFSAGPVLFRVCVGVFSSTFLLDFPFSTFFFKRWNGNGKTGSCSKVAQADGGLSEQRAVSLMAWPRGMTSPLRARDFSAFAS